MGRINGGIKHHVTTRKIRGFSRFHISQP